MMVAAAGVGAMVVGAYALVRTMGDLLVSISEGQEMIGD